MFSTTLRTLVLLPGLAAVAPAGVADGHDAAGVSTRAPVTTEVALRRAWTDPLRRRIDLGADIVLRDCEAGDPMRESPYPLVLDGHGHTLARRASRSACCARTGPATSSIRDATLTRGGVGRAGRGADVARRAPVHGRRGDEEPRRGARRRIFSMRGITVRSSHINGNLANDDGGGMYARRGGVAGLRLRAEQQPRRRVRRRRSGRRATSSSSGRRSTATRPTATAARSTPTRTAT